MVHFSGSVSQAFFFFFFGHGDLCCCSDVFVPAPVQVLIVVRFRGEMEVSQVDIRPARRMMLDRIILRWSYYTQGLQTNP